MDEATVVAAHSAPDAQVGKETPKPHRADPSMPVRSADLEPYTGLGYLSKLFKLMAAVLLLLLLSEIVTGLIAQGTAAIPTLLGEISRLVVLAGLLYGTGDLALLLIDIGHDIRATRILLGRQALHEDQQQHKRDPAEFVERGPR
jgi:hypothetical protein